MKKIFNRKLSVILSLSMIFSMVPNSVSNFNFGKSSVVHAQKMKSHRDIPFDEILPYESLAFIKDDVLRKIISGDLSANGISDSPYSIDFAIKHLTHIDAENIDRNSNEFAYNYPKKIKTLEGIERFKNLEYLNITIHDVEDLKPLESLTNLEYFVAIGDFNSKGRIKDITPLKNNIKLKKIFLGNNQISDITVISNFNELEELGLEDNKVKDISSLKNLKKLVYLNLERNEITDISPILGLKIESLFYNGNPIDNSIKINKVIVENGTSDKQEYKKGEKVTIKSNPPQEGYIFDKWTSNDVTIDNPTSEVATFTMPEKSVKVTANYKKYNPITNISITTDNILMTQPTTDVILKVEPQDYSDTLMWESYNEDIATVENGKVKAVSKGETTITVKTSTGINVKTKVTVEQIAVDKISLDQELQKAKSKNIDKYTKETIEILQKEIEQSENLIKDEKATKEQIEMQLNSLKKAIQDLKEKQNSSSSSSSSSGGGGGGGSTSHKKQEKLKEESKKEEAKKQTSENKEKAPISIEKLQFEDVKQDSWYAKSVNYVIKNNLMVGITDKNFAPNQNTTRAMIVTVLHRLSKDTSINTNEFKDVESGKWYANAVSWASKNNIVSGYDGNKFKPNQDITREEMITILYNYSKSKGYDIKATTSLSNFKDNSQVSEYAKEAMKWAVEKGIISGINGDLSPQSMTTRAQLAVILEKFVEKFEKNN